MHVLSSIFSLLNKPFANTEELDKRLNRAYKILFTKYVIQKSLSRSCERSFNARGASTPYKKRNHFSHSINLYVSETYYFWGSSLKYYLITGSTEKSVSTKTQKNILCPSKSFSEVRRDWEVARISRSPAHSH